MATKQVNISLSDKEYGELTNIKEVDGFGATTVMRLGIKYCVEKKQGKLYALETENNELKLLNEKLATRVQTLARRVYELEQSQVMKI